MGVIMLNKQYGELHVTLRAVEWNGTLDLEPIISSKADAATLYNCTNKLDVLYIILMNVELFTQCHLNIPR